MELEELKQQWDVLHKKLDEQQIINKRLMENAVRQNVKSISSENWRGLVVIIFTIPFICIMQYNFKSLDTNVFYFGLFFLFISLLFSIYSTFLFDKIMKKNSVLEREKGLLKFKKMNFLSTIIGAALGIFFMVGVIISSYEQYMRAKTFEMVILLSVTAMGFGVWLTYKYFRKINELHQSISDLKEFEKE